MPKKKAEAQQNEEMLNFIDAMKELAKEKGLDEELLLDILEKGIKTALKKEFDINDQDSDKEKRKKEGAAAEPVIDADERIEVEIDRENGVIIAALLKEVVEEVRDEKTEISLAEAEALFGEGEVEVGDQVPFTLDASKFGRNAATAAKSRISELLRNAEDARLRDIFEDKAKAHDIVTGKIVRKTISSKRRDKDGKLREKYKYYVEVDKAETVLPEEEQVEGERYDIDSEMKFIVLAFKENGDEKKAKKKNDLDDDRKNEKKERPAVIVSRKSEYMIKKLFEIEVPEIRSGEVIIKSVARESGNRAKIAVMSRDENIDAKGACVGPKGQRVQAVMEGIGGLRCNEKIDIVEYSDDPEVFVCEALQPARVERVEFFDITDEDEMTDNRGRERIRYTKGARVIVPDDQFSLAIGKRGINAKLANKLTGYKIDIIKESEYAAAERQKMIDMFKPVEEEETADQDGEQ